MTDDALAAAIEGFRSVPPATIGHVRASGFVDTAIRAIYRVPGIVVGRAVTLQLAPGDVSHTRDALNVLRAGDILVIDQAGDRHAACWGEMTSLAAKVRGAAGVIIDGSCTDLVEIQEMGMPTFARGLAALVGRRLSHAGGVNLPVACGGVVVNAGDVVVADVNGIVVMPPADAVAIYPIAREYEDRAPHQRRWILGGGLLSDLTGLNAKEIEAKVAARAGGATAG